MMGVDEALEEYKRVAGGLASRLEKKCAGPSVIEAEMLAGVTTSLHAPVVSDGPEAFRQARITISIMMVMGSDDDHDHACVAMEKLEMLEMDAMIEKHMRAARMAMSKLATSDPAPVEAEL